MRLRNANNHARFALACSFLMVVLPSHACAQANSAPAAIMLDAASRKDVVDTMAARLRRHYVDADTGRMIADHVVARLTQGAYNTITSPARFAEVLTADLRSVNDDKH
ncbi:MAG: hypothetical protein ABIT38_16010, partial [Gemmatimonadaceae bacterium]